MKGERERERDPKGKSKEIKLGKEMGRAPCCDKANVKKGPWSPEEDSQLKHYIESYGTGGNWISLPQKAGLRRCGKSCRLRWLNYLRPNIKHGEFSAEEDRIICTLFATIGSRWSIIAAQLPGRTDNDIKNYWNTKLKKKLMGLMLSNSKKFQSLSPILPHQNSSFDQPLISNNTLDSSIYNYQTFPSSSSSSSSKIQPLNSNLVTNHHPFDQSYNEALKINPNQMQMGFEFGGTTGSITLNNNGFFEETTHNYNNVVVGDENAMDYEGLKKREMGDDDEDEDEEKYYCYYF